MKALGVLLAILLVASVASAQPSLPDTPDVKAQYEKCPIGQVCTIASPKPGDTCGNTCAWRVRRVSESEIQVVGFHMCEKRLCIPEPPKRFK